MVFEKKKYPMPAVLHTKIIFRFYHSFHKILKSCSRELSRWTFSRFSLSRIVSIACNLPKDFHRRGDNECLLMKVVEIDNN